MLGFDHAKIRQVFPTSHHLRAEVAKLSGQGQRVMSVTGIGPSHRGVLLE